MGEFIASIRIGVADVDANTVTWLAIEAPPEGFYVGQVEWAGNSNEVLVEQFSRFLNQPEFQLVSLDGKVISIFAETNEA